MKDACEMVGFVLGNEVAFVDHDHVCKFDLIGQQIDDRPFILAADAQIAIVEFLLAVEVAEKIGGINHRRHRVHLGDITETLPFFISKREGRCHRHGLADTR